MHEPSVSVILPSLNEGQNLVDTVRCIFQNSAYQPLEVIIADDGSTDGSPQMAQQELAEAPLRIVPGNGGVARARNAGAQAARGEVLVFMDAHCYVPEGWLHPLVEALAAKDVGMAGPAFSSIRAPRMQACGVTWNSPSLENVWLPCTSGPEPVPFHIGACQAVRADVFRELGGCDDGMTRWGSEDIELCLRMWLMGYQVIAQPQSLVYHLFRTSRNYEVDARLVMYNHLRFAMLHFDETTLSKVIRHSMSFPEIEKSLAMAMTDGTWQTREKLLAERRNSFEWFCQRFGIVI